MNKVKIIVDSTVDLTEQIYKENNIDVIPLNVNFGTETYKDYETIKPDLLYKLVSEKGVLPQTSATAPYVIEEVFKKYIDEGFDIFFIGIGSGFSSEVQNAKIAASSFPEDRIFVVDSMNLSSGTGLLVLRAIKLAKEGKSCKEIAEHIESIKGKVKSQFVVDTLEYLHKGGRCSGASKMFGQLFHIHPVIQVQDGKMVVYKKPRGPMKIAIKELINELVSDMPNIDMDNIMVTNSGDSIEEDNYLVSEVQKVTQKQNTISTQAGCIVSTHCGPRTIGVLYIIR